MTEPQDHQDWTPAASTFLCFTTTTTTIIVQARTMLMKEYRICMPLTVEEVGQVVLVLVTFCKLLLSDDDEDDEVGGDEDEGDLLFTN